jgi:hypothetical protein
LIRITPVILEFCPHLSQLGVGRKTDHRRPKPRRLRPKPKRQIQNSARKIFKTEISMASSVFTSLYPNGPNRPIFHACRPVRQFPLVHFLGPVAQYFISSPNNRDPNRLVPISALSTSIRLSPVLRRSPNPRSHLAIALQETTFSMVRRWS